MIRLAAVTVALVSGIFRGSLAADWTGLVSRRPGRVLYSQRRETGWSRSSVRRPPSQLPKSGRGPPGFLLRLRIRVGVLDSLPSWTRTLAASGPASSTASLGLPEADSRC